MQKISQQQLRACQTAGHFGRGSNVDMDGMGGQQADITTLLIYCLDVALPNWHKTLDVSHISM